MLCRRALPSLRPSVLTPLTTLLHRPFSSILTSRFSPSLPTTTTPTPTTSSLSTRLQLQQTRTFSASAALAGKRNTYNPSRRVQKRRHGFLARLRTRGGRKVLLRRRARGKKVLSW